MTISDWALFALDPAPDGVTFNIIYTYDAAGNRLSMDDGTTFTSYTYTNANRLILANAGGAITTFTNDAAGNRTQQQSPSDTIVYSWDAPGRMTVVEVAAGSVTLTHNADGQRTAKQSTDSSVTGFLYDHKKLLAETDDVGGDVTNLYATTSDGEFGDLISEDSDTSFHQYDAQADTNALLDNTGTVQAQYRYYAFGNVSELNLEGAGWNTMTQADWESLPLDLSSHMLAGGKKQYYLDMETALYILGIGTNGRPVDSLTGRFLCEDPTRWSSGETNLYRYVHNDPIDRLDPSGHDDDPNKPKNTPPVTPPADKKAESDKRNQTGTSTPPKVTPPIPAKLPGTESIPGKPIDQSFDPAVKGAAAGDVHGGTTAASPNERKEPQDIQSLKDSNGKPIQLASTDNSAMAGAVTENKQPTADSGTPTSTPTNQSPTTGASPTSPSNPSTTQPSTKPSSTTAPSSSQQTSQATTQPAQQIAPSADEKAQRTALYLGQLADDAQGGIYRCKNNIRVLQDELGNLQTRRVPTNPDELAKYKKQLQALKSEIVKNQIQMKKLQDDFAAIRKLYNVLGLDNLWLNDVVTGSARALGGTGLDAAMYLAPIAAHPNSGGLVATGDEMLIFAPFLGALADLAGLTAEELFAKLRFGASDIEPNLDLTDPQGRQHILEGDATGGGHGPGRGVSGKSEFPSSWSDQRILNEISDMATDPKQTWSPPDPRNGYITTTKTVDGIKIKLVYDPAKARIVTAYPTNVPRNP